MVEAVTLVGLVVALAGFSMLDRAADGVEVDADGLWWHALKWLVPLVLFGVLALEGEPLASIGFRTDGPVRLAYESLVAFAALLGSSVVLSPLWARLGGNADVAAGIGSFARFSPADRLAIALTAGVTEEVAYRGYAIERLAALTGSAPLAGVVSAAAFTLAHRGETWSPAAVARIAQPAVVLTVCYLWTRSLLPLVVAHVANDVVGLALAGRYADRE